jgi:hypothetical protein
VHDGGEGDHHLSAARFREEHPVTPYSGQTPGELTRARSLHSHHPVLSRAQPVDKAQLPRLVPRPLCHLAGQIGGGSGVELSLQVGEQRLPPLHGAPPGGPYALVPSRTAKSVKG